LIYSLQSCGTFVKQNHPNLFLIVFIYQFSQLFRFIVLEATQFISHRHQS